MYVYNGHCRHTRLWESVLCCHMMTITDSEAGVSGAKVFKIWGARSRAESWRIDCDAEILDF